MWSSNSGHEHTICGHEYFTFLTPYACYISKHTFIMSGSSKRTLLFNLTSLNTQFDQQIVAMSTQYGHEYFTFLTPYAIAF